jgi:hypothetical protein
MKTPIEQMLDTIKYTPVTREKTDETDRGLPFVTHEGVLDLGVCKFKVFVLSNGERVINKEDLEKFFLRNVEHKEDGEVT